MWLAGELHRAALAEELLAAVLGVLLTHLGPEAAPRRHQTWRSARVEAVHQRDCSEAVIARRHLVPGEEVELRADDGHGEVEPLGWRREAGEQRQVGQGGVVQDAPDVELAVVDLDVALPAVEAVAGAEQPVGHRHDLVRRHVELPHPREDLPRAPRAVEHLGRAPLQRRRLQHGGSRRQEGGVAGRQRALREAPHDVEAALPRHADALVAQRAHVRERRPLPLLRVVHLGRRRAPGAGQRALPAGHADPAPARRAREVESWDQERRAVVPLAPARVVPQHVCPHADVGVVVLAGLGTTLPPAEPAADDVHGFAQRRHGEPLQYVAVRDARERAHAAPHVGARLVALETVGAADRKAHVYPDAAIAAAGNIATAAAAASGAGEGRRSGDVTVQGAHGSKPGTRWYLCLLL